MSNQQPKGERRAGFLPMLALAAGALLISACTSRTPSPLPAGEAGYIAVESAMATSKPGPYRLRAGDIVAVEVYGEDDLSSDAITLDDMGNIVMPLIGEVAAAGLSAAELGDTVETAYAARYLRDPTVSVSIKQAQARLITVEGQVRQPGSFPYSEGQTLLTALALARSPTEIAALRDVAVYRNVDGQRYGGLFDIQAIRAGQMRDLELQPGDLVVVGHSPSRVAARRLLSNIPLLGALAPL